MADLSKQPLRGLSTTRRSAFRDVKTVVKQKILQSLSKTFRDSLLKEFSWLALREGKIFCTVC